MTGRDRSLIAPIIFPPANNLGQWLLDQFETTGQPVEVLERGTGKAPRSFDGSSLTYATCKGWLITRKERLGVVGAHADWIGPDNDLIIRPRQWSLRQR
jgi:hypothetical protein